jgi:histidyl-tRNA synthetase
MSQKIQGVRGMNDLLPADMAVWHQVESALRKIGWQYGYQEIRTPMLEKSALFMQSIGEQTDIVEKEMYTFKDSGEEILSLRPEATASTVRACIQHGILHNQQQRFWYMGPMFRRERPQKGRYRQFHQFGIEAFGWPGPDIDSEIIRVGERIWKELEVTGVSLEINSLGSVQSRQLYRDALKSYLQDHLDQLDEDSLRRLDRNPLRILDSKHSGTRQVVADAPEFMQFLSPREASHFDGICNSLQSSGIQYRVNPRLVRGLDYYTSTVFEWTSDQLGAQAAVCAGGRYDSLVENRGGRSTPAIGFAMGMERLIELVKLQETMAIARSNLIYVADTSSSNSRSIGLSEKLRDAGYDVKDHCGGGKLKNQLKRADQAGAVITLITGQQELDADIVQIKHMRDNSDQVEVPVSQLVEWCRNNLQKN